jgi:hypothetical protein
MKRTLVAVGAAVLCLSGPLSIARAQQSGAPVLDSLHPQIEPWPAPVGHRQPRRRDLPPGASRDEGASTPGQRGFDDSLSICRC